jgi:pimeloyl-ACP methyl ester carboxylesterase
MIATARDGVPLHYTVSGDGETVVLVHGTTATHAVWRPQVAAYSATFRTVCVDMRGTGGSGVPANEASYSVAQMAHDVGSVLDHLGVDRAHVGGISLGGGVALRFTLDFPERVASLHLVSAWARTDEFLRRTFFEPLGRALERGEAREGFRYAIALMMSPHYLETREPPEVAELITEIFVRDPVAPAGYRGHLHAGRAHDEHARLGEAPTLVLAGEHDANVPPRYAHALADGIAGAALHVFRGPRAGHCPNIEMPEKFNETTVAFLCAHREGAKR